MNLQDIFAKLRNEEITVIDEGVKVQFRSQEKPCG